ncbi:MAG: hypothetical protein JWN04_104 [Myxococcaceae bacterium]|nr:hypothetical protein [Myxococcaceae bacterium]
MADNKNLRGAPDRDLISLDEDYERTRWAKKFGVTEEQLRAAVKAVGHAAQRVEAHLAQHKR